MADHPDSQTEPQTDQKGGQRPKLETAIGAEIRRQRKRQDMTMAMLSDAAGLSQGMLSKIENGSNTSLYSGGSDNNSLEH